MVAWNIKPQKPREYRFNEFVIVLFDLVSDYLLAQGMSIYTNSVIAMEVGPSPLDTNGLCLLSLDGGGVRGLSSLLILKDMMIQLNSEREDSEILKPCDVFDLIGGTSTGGCVLTNHLVIARLTCDF